MLKPAVSLRHWIWKSFSQSALIPLLLVETLLVAAYFFTNNSIRAAQIDYLRNNALSALKSSAQVEARVIDEQLSHIQNLTELYRSQTALALLTPADSSPLSLSLNSEGVRYSPYNQGGAAVFYSNITPVAQQDLEKVARLTTLDPLMKTIADNNSLIAALYFNSWDSLNHIYPWFLTPEQYPSNMNIPEYNFYYLADLQHNPERTTVWTDVYLDPAGQGWMMSAIAPVYRGDFLEGAVGIDITVEGILEQIRTAQVPWNGFAMLVSEQLNIMAMPEAGEHSFALDELTHHSYAEAIRSEQFKPKDFDLRLRADTRALSEKVQASAHGVEQVSLGGEPHLVAWASIPATDWHLLTIASEKEVFQKTNHLANYYARMGIFLIGGLILFYILFFSVMWQRVRLLGQTLMQPISAISQMMEHIGRGHLRSNTVSTAITELQEMADHTFEIGERLAISEDQRRSIQQRLELVLDSVTESLWEHDFRDQYLTLRGRFCHRFGLSGESLPTQEFFARVHPEDLPLLRKRLHDLLTSNIALFGSEYRFADADGNYCWILSRGKVIERDAQGLPVVLAGTHVDITQLKQAEEDLRHAMIDARAASDAKSRFISSMSHELRTPLNAIKGFAQLLQLSNPPLPPLATGHLAEILTASEHLSQLVNDILDLSNIQAAPAVADWQTLDVTHLVRECSNMIRTELASHHLSLELSLPEQPLMLRTDGRRLRQIVLNLLSNAIKYNRPQGRITLHLEQHNDRVRIAVEDTGIGIEYEKQARLFIPFERLGQENSAIPGTGIGLPLCRELALILRGEIGFTSHPAKGSCFWVLLPLDGCTTREMINHHLIASPCES